MQPCPTTPYINVFDLLGGLWGTGKIALQDKANIYVLKDRIKTLRNQDAGVILVHVAENKSKVRLYIQLLEFVIIYVNIYKFLYLNRDIQMKHCLEVLI